MFYWYSSFRSFADIFALFALLSIAKFAKREPTQRIRKGSSYQFIFRTLRLLLFDKLQYLLFKVILKKLQIQSLEYYA
ncbi:hypothetical protein SAMN02745131_01513 [Flavisolibacter ginsengisoli DSM 18119]|uniref:Uncharacterized protein n=1 Tax=Flavisolibacter ginsengisoli DSM 18119 TaxID=1121884 RepID=A0A1M4XWX1_9BACT|nr:hypothetical protein SAMN02745131_01513 [Flavisolibacter ginsengisoli DSM 18119]